MICLPRRARVEDNIANARSRVLDVRRFAPVFPRVGTADYHVVAVLAKVDGLLFVNFQTLDHVAAGIGGKARFVVRALRQRGRSLRLRTLPFLVPMVRCLRLLLYSIRHHAIIRLISDSIDIRSRPTRRGLTDCSHHEAAMQGEFHNSPRVVRNIMRQQWPRPPHYARNYLAPQSMRELRTAGCTFLSLFVIRHLDFVIPALGPWQDGRIKAGI